MQELSEGFQIEGRRFPWGTTPGELARLLGRAPGETLSHDEAIPCRLAYGLPALSARPSAPAIDRPVLTVAYDLADVRALRPEDWVGAIGDRLGAPVEVNRYELASGGRPEDSVILNAHWTLGDIGVSLSIFGGPREVEAGNSIGTLWVSWRDELAAAPYLADWNERSARLAASSRGLTDIRIYALAWPGHPAYGSGEGRTEPADGRERRHRRLCLHAPELLTTPDAVARRLSATRFPIWVNEPEQVWCASTHGKR